MWNNESVAPEDPIAERLSDAGRLWQLTHGEAVKADIRRLAQSGVAKRGGWMISSAGLRLGLCAALVSILLAGGLILLRYPSEQASYSSSALPVQALTEASATSKASDTPKASNTQLPLKGVDWVLKSFAIKGKTTGSAVNPKPSLVISKSGRVDGSDGCNIFSGEAIIAKNLMTVNLTISTTVLCIQSLDVQALISGRTTWAIHGDELTIAHGQFGTLTYEAQR